MSKTLLVVMSYGGAAAQVSWSFKYYRRSGYDIMGTCPKNSSHQWPRGTKYWPTAGLNGYMNDTLIRRWIDTLAMVLSPAWAEYSDFCVIEYDSIFLGPLKEFRGGLRTHHAGTLPKGINHHDTNFFHCPWHFDRACGNTIVNHGRRLISRNNFQRGSPDVFLGKIIHDTGIKWEESNTFSVNGGCLSYAMPEAIKASSSGCSFFHGLRSESEAHTIEQAQRK